MKTMIKAAAITIFTLSAYTAAAQTNKDSVAKWLNDKQFLFVANSADPLRGRTRFLTGSYDVKVKNDSLVSYLPYFGRSQVAPMNTDDAGLTFTSTNFTYSFSPGKKDRWDVVLIIKDQSNVSKYVLTVFSDGTADLTASSNFRDQISFRGYVRAIKKEK
jgi:flagellar hook protein FlgE